MDKVVVITVPHKVCPPDSQRYGREHLCDYLAYQSALTLEKCIKSSVKMFVSDKPRMFQDYNRRSSRDASWRKQIANYIDRENVNVLLDVHSFPLGSFSKKGNENPEIVILDSYHENYTFLDRMTSYDFEEYLRGEGISVLLEFGGDNDITREAREKGVRSILLEFNESLSQDRLKYISEKICTFFSI